MSRNSDRIAALNDDLRAHIFSHPPHGIVLLTQGVQALGDPDVITAIVVLVRDFSDFNKDNDPYHEHDFGTIVWRGSKLFWKIDYYAKGSDMYGSDDPADAKITDRVLTIMLASEY